MKVYKFINLDNGDILLEKVQILEENYKIIDKTNGDKLFKKISNIKVLYSILKNMIIKILQY